MSKWDRWFESGGLAAIHRESSWCLREPRVPDSVNAFPLGDARRVLTSGEGLDQTALLVFANPLRLELNVDGLTDSSGVSADLSAVLHIDPPSTPSAARLLRDNVLVECEEFTAAELEPRIAQIIQSELTPWLEARTWEGSDGLIARLNRPEFVSALLRESLFDMGLSLARIIQIQVTSPVLEAVRQRREKVERESERVQQRLEVLELRQREKTGERLARAEVEQLEADLERENALREADRRREAREREIDFRREEAKARAELRRVLERERLALEAEIHDQRVEYELARAEQLEAVDQSYRRQTPNDSDYGALEQRLEEVLSRLEGRAPEWVTSLPRVDSVWLVAGLALYRVGTEFENAQPVLPDRDLGHLRSVATFRVGGRTEVWVGAQNGVGAYTPATRTWQTYLFPEGSVGRGGVNSVLPTATGVLATHSQLGLRHWDPQSSRSTTLHADRVQPFRSTRGLSVGPGGRVYFAHQRELLSLDMRNPNSPPIRHGTFAASITALAADAKRVVVGTREGRIHEWGSSSGEVEFPFRLSSPIFSIAALGSESAPGWVVGGRQPAVHVLDSRGRRIRDFTSRHPVRWVGSGREGVFGVDRLGLALQVWDWQATDSPVRSVRVPDQIRSLAVEYGSEGLDGVEGEGS